MWNYCALSDSLKWMEYGKGKNGNFKIEKPGIHHFNQVTSWAMLISCILWCHGLKRVPGLCDTVARSHNPSLIIKKISDKTTLRVRESIPRQVDKKPSIPEEEREVCGSQGGRKDKCLFFFSLSTFLSLSHIKHFCFL